MSVPPGWTATTIGEVTERVDKCLPTERPDQEFTYIDISSIKGTAIRDPKRLLGKDAPSRARQVTRAGDVLLSTVRTNLKHTALVPHDLDEAVASTGFAVLRPASVIEPRFLFFRVLEQGFVDALSAKQTGSSYPAVRDKDVRAMPIAFPEFAEQQQIVAAIEEQFSRLDAGVHTLGRAVRSLHQLRTSALQNAVTGNGSSRPKDGSESGPTTLDPERRFGLPSGWTWRSLGELCVSITDGDHQPPPQTTEGIPFLVIGNVRNGRVDFADCRHVPLAYYDSLKPIRQPRPGDVLYTLVGSFGIPVLIQDAAPFCVQRHIAILRPGPEIRSEYLAAVLASRVAYAQAASCATGTAQMTVPLAGLRRIEVPLPPAEIQREIVQQLGVVDTRTEHLSDALRAANKRALGLRTAILAAAFSGKLARDPEARSHR